MKFFGDGGSFLELTRPSDIAAGKLTLTARLCDAEREIWTKNIAATADEIRALADWLENFWDPCPNVNLGSLGFIYSHREHIGEGYYDITESGIKILFVYEQLGGSNVASARELRALLG